MKLDKKLVICTMIVLMIFLCINASSATEQLNQTLESDFGDEIAISDVSNEELSVSGSNDGLKNPVDDTTLTAGDAIYVSESGNNESDGQSRATAVKTIAKAVELANAGPGRIIILEGTYAESNIVLDENNPIDIAGEGNVVIDGGSSSESIFVMHGGDATFTNIKFTNANPSYGGAIFMNYGTGRDRTVIEVNVIVDNCTFDGISSSSRGGAVYAGYVQGVVMIENSKFYNINGGSWGGAVCACYSPDLDVEITNCKFENNSANNGGAAYLQVNTVMILNSIFNNNSASADSGAFYIYNATATVDNCIITNNKGGSSGVAVKFTKPNNGAVKTLTVSNSVIENNTATTGTLSAIYVDMETLYISYSSLINDLSIETRTGSGYDAVYGQGIAVANNNWWGTNDPETKVTGKNITIDKWVIMNVEANASEVKAGDEVTLTVDFKHVNTTSGEIKQLTGGVIPKESYDVKLTAENGTIEPDSLIVSRNEIKQATFTANDVNALINVKSAEASVDIIFKNESSEPAYLGIVYVDKEGKDNNNGSENAPVASISKAIEIANKGSGQIIINEGSYTGNGYQVTKALNITGKGNVVLDADGGRLFTMASEDSVDWLILTNLTVTGADNDYGQAIYSFADELILTNVTLTNNPGSGSLIKSFGKITMDNCVIANHNGGNVIESSGNGDIIINNSLFENNVVTDNAIVYSSSISGNVIIENTTFRSNTGKLGIVKVSKKTTVKDSRFINNTNKNAYGGAINDFDELTVTNSTFIANKADKDSGAIHVGFNRKATITKSVFINNTAGTGKNGDAISNSGKLTINYCVLLTNGENSLIYSSSEDTVNAQYNWWGTNKNPKSLNGVGTYEDGHGDDVFSEIDTSNWVIMNVTSNLTQDMIDVGYNVEVTVDFTNYMDSTNTLKPLSESIPEVDVSASAINGKMDNAKATTSNGIAKFVYVADTPGEDIIYITSANAFKEIPLTVNGTVDSIIIYVDANNGLDTNDGKTKESAVKTIEKAVEIANGKIIILAGEYTVNSLLNITKDLEIIAEGDVVVKSNSTYNITFQEWDDWDEEWVTNSETHYTLIENNATLYLENIKFTLVPESIKDPLIINNANLFVNTSKFTNIKVTSSKGVIQNIKEATLKVNGTTFKASSSTYGAINNNGELLVNNSKFLDIDKSSESGVYSTAVTSYNKAAILNSEFKNNKGSAGGAVYVMYSYTNMANPVMEIENCTFIDNQACGSYGDGAAVKCSGNQVNLTISNSTFSNNMAVRNGGAIYAQGNVNISQCVFINNSADAGNAIYAYGGNVNVSDSIILESGNAISIYESSYSDPATVSANENWWGTNDAPANIGNGVTVDSWVKMEANFAPYTAQAGDEVTVTATFDSHKLPEGVIKVAFTSTSGNLNEVVTVYGAQASTTYTIDINDASINATSGDACVVMPIETPAPSGTIFVSYESGDDSRDGLSADNAVKSISHAIELANAGIGKIILLNGTHILDETLTVTKDLEIKGLGTVIVDGNKTGFIQNDANLNLTNIGFTNGFSPDSGLINTGSTGKYINLNKVKFYKNSGKNGIYAPENTKLVVNNSKFYDNNLFEANENSQGVIYSNASVTIVENVVFRNNTANRGAGIYVIKGSLNVINCTFDSNVAQNGNGAGIYLAGDSLVADISDSTFASNLAGRSDDDVGGYGSAIYIGDGASTTSIAHSVFINNKGNGLNKNDTGIYVSDGSLDISNSIILTDDADAGYAINVAGGTVTAENNWWGSNDKANTNAEVSKIVKMNVTLTPEDAQVDDEVAINVTFDNENLPKGIINVTFTSTSGQLNELITMNTSQASLNYTINERDLSISVKSSQAKVLFPFDPESGVIFVLPGADDANPGTREAPVGTISKALELATKGKIVLLEGTHKTDDLGIVSDELSITGEGKVIIDAQNSNRILYVGEDAKVVISNVIMVNGYTIEESGALLGSSNELTLINCTLANSSASENNGGAIFSVGKLTIINTTIANCTSIRGGAIYTQTEKENTSITIINSTFENNIAKGKETWGGGAIYAQRTGGLSDFTLTIDNSSFIDNKALGTSCGGAIQLEQLNFDAKITNSEFISNHATGKAGLGGGAIYASSPSSYQRQGTITIEGTLFENNTCDLNGGAILAKTTTVKVSNSVLINNTDSDGLAVYGLKSEAESPSITLNDNWWGTNQNPKDLVGGNNYKPTLNRWAILTITNDTPITQGNTVKLAVSINNYTTGTQNGTLSKPITVKRSGTIKTTFEEIKGTLVNGEFTYDYLVPENLKFIGVTVDGETQILYALSAPVTVELDDIAARKYDKVTVEINVTSSEAVNVGAVELYVNGDKLIATIEVKDSKAIGEVVFSENEGKYNLTARYVNGLPLFENNDKNATLTVEGVYGLYNETFFNFFDEGGILRDEITEDELIFHGEFSNLGVNAITIPRSISIKGDGAKLYDIALYIQSDDVNVNNMTLIAEGCDFTTSDGAAILATGSNIELNNVSVNYIAPSNVAAYCILVKSAFGFKLYDSTIVFDANNKAGLIQQAGLIIDGSSDVEIKGNLINATLPARDVAYNYYYSELTGIYQDLVLGIGMQDCENVNFTDNEVNVDAKSAESEYATIDSFMADSTNFLLIKANNFTQTDFTGVGKAGYANVVDLYSFEDVTVENNNILINTTTGTDGAGTAYPIQATGPYSGLIINENNLTSISKGPALGIYSQNYDGQTDIVITNNYINVTGYATADEYALVSGMELQDTFAKVYNNIIYSRSISSYNDINQLYGISYAQYTSGIHTYDIRYNTIYTDGKYSIYFKSAKNTNVTDNTLYANELVSDDSVKIAAGENNIVKDNLPSNATKLSLKVDNITVGEDAIIYITITGNDNGIVTVDVDGKSYVVDMADGFGNKTISGLVAGDYTVNATFKSNIGGEDVVCSTVFNVAKLDSNVNISISDAELGSDAVISVSIPGASGNVTIIVNGKEENIALESGNANYTVEDIAAGDYYVVAYYPGDKDHASAYAADSFTVPKLESEVEITADSQIKVGEKTTISVNVTDGTTGFVIINVNGTQYAIDLEKTNNVTVVFDKAGEYSVVATYSGDDNYNASKSNTANIIVTEKQAANIEVEIPEEIYVGDRIIINITADTDSEMIVYINGEIQTFLLQNAPLSVSLMDILNAVNNKVAYEVSHVGMYNITVIAKENENYTSQIVTVMFEASKRDAELNITPIIDAKVGDNITIEVENVTDGDLTIKINGETVTGEYEIIKAGSYTVTAESAGTDAYNAGFTTYTFDVEEEPTEPKQEVEINIITPSDVKAGNNTSVDVIIPNATGNVTVIVDGSETAVNLTGNQIVSVAIENITAGNHSVVVIYSGDDKYNGAFKTTTFEVEGEPINPETNITVVVDGKEYSAVLYCCCDS